MEVIGKIETGGIKRLYAEGAIFKTRCPDCGSEIMQDFGDDYLSYVEQGDNGEASIYCDACDVEYLFTYTVKSTIITLEVGNDLKRLP